MKRFALLCAGALATLTACADSVSRGVGPEAASPSTSGSPGGYTWTVKKELLEVHALDGKGGMPKVKPPYVIPSGTTLWFSYRITYTKTPGGSQGETAQITDDGVAACASVGLGFSCTSPDPDLGENGGKITSKTWTVSGSGTRDILIDVKNENAVCPHNRTLTNTVSLTSNGITSSSSASVAVFTATTPPAGCTPPPPPPLVAGCTPGYWKQSHHFDSWPMGYAPNRLIGTVFSGTTAAPYNLGGTTMVNALQGDGGPTIVDAARILLRAATAAVLNSASTSFSYPLTTAQIVAQVNGALATQNRATILNLATTLDRYNNARCPLN